MWAADALCGHDGWLKPKVNSKSIIIHRHSGLACGGAQTRFVGMMQYDGDLKLPARFLVPPPAIHGVSGKLLADAGVTTFACSETQKFGHVRLELPCTCSTCHVQHTIAIATALCRLSALCS